MKARAFAKINLSLEVKPLRPDGYHPYVSLATSVGLADTLTITRVKRPAGGVKVVTSTGVEDLLTTRGAEAVLARTDPDVALDIHVDKQIPLGSGLGGGSADAAAAMVAVERLLEADLPLEELATDIGTDVPFCVQGGFARLHGRGELVDSRPPLPAFGILIAVPPVVLSTRSVFAAFEEIRPEIDRPPIPDWLADLIPDCSFRNDLEAAACLVEPELPAWKSVVEDVVGTAAFMTGSGSGFVCYAEDANDLDDAVAELHHEGVAAWSTEPVDHGIRLIG